MEHLTIQNFKYGLDTRKSELTSQPGTLTTLENAIINQGGEVEKRKGFFLNGTTGQLPTGCFGLQETGSAIYTFGSGAASLATTKRQRDATTCTLTFAVSPGYTIGSIVRVAGVGGTGYNGDVAIAAISINTISYLATSGSGVEGLTNDTGGTVIFPLNLPTNVSYQRLRHFYFDQYEGNATLGFIVNSVGGWFAKEPAMTGVLVTSSFGGETFVTATYGAVVKGSALLAFPASTMLFGNGHVILDHMGGVEMADGGASGETEFINIQFAWLISHYFGTDIVGTAEVSNDTLLTGPEGQAFSLELSSSNTLLRGGTGDTVIPEANTLNQVSAPTLAISSKVSFYLTGGNSGSLDTLTAPNCSTGVVSGTVALISAPVAYATSLLITAQNVATAVNANTSTTGYTATAALADLSGSKVAMITIAGITSYGALPNAGNLTYDTSSTLKGSNTSVAGSGGFTSTTVAFAGGVNQSGATGQITIANFNASVGAKWLAGDTWTGLLTFNDIAYTLGYGNIGGVVPTFAMALGNKLYFTYADQFNFCKIGDLTHWEDQDTGAGFVHVQDFYSSPTDLVTLCPYQGKLAVFGRRNIQIYSVNADPALYAQTQSLLNIGTFAKLSAQPLGDIDVIFLSDTGIRSLRTKDISLSAYVVDIGSPIDSLVRANLLSNTATNNAAACGVVEPINNNYWLHLNGTIYVLSEYQSLKISAWSTFLPQYEVYTALTADAGTYPIGGSVGYTGLVIGQVYKLVFGAHEASFTCGTDTFTASCYFVATATTATLTGTIAQTVTATLSLVTQTTFTPVKFLSFQGQVYCLTSDNRVIIYGGTDNNTYDTTVATAELPWLDHQTPFNRKTSKGIEVAMAGRWKLYASMDPYSALTQLVYTFGSATAPDVKKDSSFDNNRIAYTARGTHFKLKAVSSNISNQKEVLSSLTFKYDKGEVT